MKQKLVGSRKGRSGERGGARLKFMLVALVLGAMAYGGYLFIPVWYQSWMLKDLMKQQVNIAATQGYPPSWVVDQLKKSGKDYSLPAEAVITPAQDEQNRITVRIQFTRPVELPGYTYHYEVDLSETSTNFLK